MDLGDAALAGMMMATIDNNNYDRVVADMTKQGMILPEYDWNNKEFKDTVESIITDWFVRHPDIKRGTGEFQNKYPQIIKMIDVLDQMANFGRIKPDEFLTLYRGILTLG